MIETIRKIQPLTHQNKSTKIGSVLTLSGSFIAYVVDLKLIKLLEYGRRDRTSIKLSGHSEEIKCMKFSGNISEELILCSCSIDRIIIWNVTEVATSYEKNWKVLKKDLDFEPNDCSFHPYNESIAVCYGDTLAIFDINTSINLYELKFKEYLCGLEYFNFDPNLILITNQNNSILVYDLEAGRVNEKLSNDEFNSVISLENENVVIASTLNGHLNIYRLLNNYQLVESISLEILHDNYMRNKEKKRGNFDSRGSFLCISLHAFSLGDQSRIEFDCARRTLNTVLICGTSSGLFFIDFDTYDLINFVDFDHMSTNIPQTIECQLIKDKQINAAFLFLFENELSVVKCAEIYGSKNKFQEDFKQQQPSSIIDNEPICSVFPNEPLLEDSPLNEHTPENEIAIKKVPSMQDFIRNTSSIKKVPISKDKPLTFNSKIRSSGYSKPVVKRDKFTPVTNKTHRSYSLTGLTEATKPKSAAKKVEFSFDLPKCLDKKFNLNDRPSSVTLMKFSDDGQNLAIGSGDNSIQYISVNNLDKPGLIYNCHKDIIRSIDISHDCKYLLSSSDDKTCKLWSLKNSNDLLIDISTIKTSGSQSYNLKKEVVASNFFYLDKFILLGTENKILLCKYHIDSKKNDVQRYLSGTYAKLVKQVDLTFAPSITAMSAINSFFSYVVITGGSDKSIEIFDMNQTKSVLSIAEAHTRNIHQIFQNGSPHNQSSYDLFLTSAVADGVKMWDMRNAKCVNHFDYHLNRCLPTKVSFSPDSNYVAVGSEDKSALVYDLRMNGTIEKYGVFSDSVTNAQFNPKKSQLICGTQDGKVYSYRTKLK